jgi:hypothetical protein
LHSRQQQADEDRDDRDDDEQLDQGESTAVYSHGTISGDMGVGPADFVAPVGRPIGP